MPKSHSCSSSCNCVTAFSANDTFSRIFRLLDPDASETCFVRFMRRFSESLQAVVAIDGKTLRRSFDRACGKSALHMLHAWSADQRLLLGQLAVDGKSNEITAVPKLLALPLNGCVVAAGALNCQRAIAVQVVGQGGDYVLGLKGNQGTLHDDVHRFLDDPARAAGAAHAAVDGGHGRIKTRTSLVPTDIGWLQEQYAWPGLAAIGRLVRTRGTAYHLLSAPLSAERFGAVARVHWSVENGVHWDLDITKKWDQARNRKDHGPQNLALLRRLALNLAKLERSRGSMKVKFKRAGWSDDFLASRLERLGKIYI